MDLPVFSYAKYGLSRFKYQQTLPIYLLPVQSNVKLKGTHHTSIIQTVFSSLFSRRKIERDRESGGSVFAVRILSLYVRVKLNYIGKGVKSFVYQNRKVTLWK